MDTERKQAVVHVEHLNVDIICPECFESIRVNDVRQFVLSLHQQKACEPLGAVLGKGDA